MNEKGIKNTRLYRYIDKHYFTLEAALLRERLMEVYSPVFRSRETEGTLMGWLASEATLEQLSKEFNEHELMELLIEDCTHP